ncbi:hypothetical protein QBC43DRAFT_332531 [Cladorrhinum sp. PSN259]|nr:hypothetical protein QBC43DRAFT_332531 [Cladorrhinum sp. PSN259]
MPVVNVHLIRVRCKGLQRNISWRLSFTAFSTVVIQNQLPEQEALFSSSRSPLWASNLLVKSPRLSFTTLPQSFKPRWLILENKSCLSFGASARASRERKLPKASTGCGQTAASLNEASTISTGRTWVTRNISKDRFQVSQYSLANIILCRDNDAAEGVMGFALAQRPEAPSHLFPQAPFHRDLPELSNVAPERPELSSFLARGLAPQSSSAVAEELSQPNLLQQKVPRSSSEVDLVRPGLSSFLTPKPSIQPLSGTSEQPSPSAAPHQHISAPQQRSLQALGSEVGQSQPSAIQSPVVQSSVIQPGMIRTPAVEKPLVHASFPHPPVVPALTIHVRVPNRVERIETLTPVPGWNNFVIQLESEHHLPPPGVVDPREHFGIVPDLIPNQDAPRPVVQVFAPGCTPEGATGVDYLGVWYSNAHDFCMLHCRHRHDWNGGVYFHTVMDLLGCAQLTATDTVLSELPNSSKNLTTELITEFILCRGRAGIEAVPLMLAMHDNPQRAQVPSQSE